MQSDPAGSTSPISHRCLSTFLLGPLQPFCEAALLELPCVSQPELWSVPEEERQCRRDLTGPDYFVCSIDPVGCTDVDDALHVRFLDTAATSADSATVSYSSPSAAAAYSGAGMKSTGVQMVGEYAEGQRVEVGVHIADVSWFVRRGGMLDAEARDRCTTVYLVDRWVWGQAHLCMRMCMCVL